MFLHLPFKHNKNVVRETKRKENSRFHLLRREERGHLLEIYEPLLSQSCKLLVGRPLQNQAGKVDPHILLT